MAWDDYQKGQYGGNRPNPNDTQANYDYIAGQNKKNADDHAARMAAASVPSWTPPPASSYTAPVSTSNYTTPASSSSSCYTPYSSSPVSSYSGGHSGRSMSAEETTKLLYPDVAARRGQSANGTSQKTHGTPWAAMLLGLIVGFGVAVIPFALSGNFYHSPYLDKMGISMALFCAGLFWAIVELKRGRGRLALFTACLGFFVPEVLWLPSTVTFLQAYSMILTRAINHLAK